MRENKKQFSKLGFFFLLGVVFMKLMQKGASCLVSEFRPEWIEDPNMNMLLSIALQYLIGMPVLILLIKRIPAEKVKTNTMKIGHFFIALMMAFALAIVSNIAGNIFTAIVGLFRGQMVKNVALELGANTSLLLNFVFMVLCAPIYEEYIFRKLVVDRTIRFGQGVAIVVSGLMFGLAHGNLNQFAYAFTVGMFFAFIYVKTGKMRYSVAMHVIFNFLSGVLLTGAMRYMNFDAYTKAALAGDVPLAMQTIMDALPAWIVMFVLVFAEYAAGIAGLVLLIVYRKKFRIEPGEITIPRKERFATIILNVGMILYCLYFVLNIVWQLFQ